MKTICFYFQVHQPWRLKRYRFFDMGRDHNYLDDLTNRSIMQKIARECYLPMNALLFNLIRQSEGRFRCTFSLTGLAVEQMRAYAPRCSIRSAGWPGRAAWSSWPKLTPIRWLRFRRRRISCSRLRSIPN